MDLGRYYMKKKETIGLVEISYRENNHYVTPASSTEIKGYRQF